MVQPVYGKWPNIPDCHGTAVINGADGVVTQQRNGWIESTTHPAPGTYNLVVDTNRTGPVGLIDVQAIVRSGITDANAIAVMVVPSGLDTLVCTTVNAAGAPADQTFYISIRAGGEVIALPPIPS
jgi:hypothetical protein